MMNLKKIDHLGIAVRSVAEAERLYGSTLGLRVVDREVLPAMKLNIVKVAIGESVLELLEPLPGETVISKFLTTHGPGLHHICFEVEDVGAATEELRRQGCTTVWDTPHPGVGNRLVNFLKPKECLGVLIELSQAGRNP